MADRVNRRKLLQAVALGAASLSLSSLFPSWARSRTQGVLRDPKVLSGENIALTIGPAPFTVGGRTGRAITVNGTLPSPLIRLREGETFRIAVTNTVEGEDAYIHWHGVLVPFQMDGVPGVSFPGIKPGETFVYEFPIRSEEHTSELQSLMRITSAVYR